MKIWEQKADDEITGKSDLIKLTPFMQSLCTPQQIIFIQECIWIIDGEQLKELQSIKLDRGIYSNTFYVMIPDHGRVSFRLSLQRREAVSRFATIGVTWGWMTPFPIDVR